MSEVNEFDDIFDDILDESPNQKDLQILKDLRARIPNDIEMSETVAHVDFSDSNVQAAIVNIPSDSVYLCSSQNEMQMVGDLFNSPLKDKQLEKYHKDLQSSQVVRNALNDVHAPWFVGTQKLIDTNQSILERRHKIASMRGFAHLNKIRAAEKKKRRFHNQESSQRSPLKGVFGKSPGINRSGIK